MSKYVADLETDGLLDEMTRIWIFVARDINTAEEFIFTDHETGPGIQPMSELPAFLDGADELIGHNFIQFDILALRKLLNWEVKPHQRVIDTMIYSQVLNYKRFGFGHSLGRWGEFLKYPKPEHEDWSQYSPEMRHRCVEDVRLNFKVFVYLIKELNGRKGKDRLKIGLKSEHAASRFVADANYYGWPFNIDKARRLRTEWSAEIAEMRAQIEPKLKPICKNVDKKDDVKEPVFIKNGHYAKRTADWFGIDQADGLKEHRPVAGPYCRVEHIEPEIGNFEALHGYLYSLGWEPQEFNFVRDRKTGRPVQSSPKMDEDSLSKLGDDGVLISRFLSVRARLGILEGWIEKSYNPETGRIHGDCFVIGTPTFRARHIGIANLPSEKALYGLEMRSLFQSIDGHTIIGADSKGNQARALCHYLDNADYTKSVIEDDIHEVNRLLLESQIGSLGKNGRDLAKRFLYAILFGGGFGKLGLILTGRRDVAAGKKVKSGFLEAIPGLKRLNNMLEHTFDTTSKRSTKPYIIGLDTRPVYTESLHKALNYLLQSCEKITCSLAIDWFEEKMAEEGIWYQPLIFYHDEIQVLVKDEDVKRTKELAELAFAEGPKRLGVTIMGGDAKDGQNYAETH